MNEDAKTKAIKDALQYVDIDAVGSFEGGNEFLSDFWDKSRVAALREAEHALWNVNGASALGHSLKNESRAWSDDRIIQWRNAGDSVMGFVIRTWRKSLGIKDGFEHLRGGKE